MEKTNIALESKINYNEELADILSGMHEISDYSPVMDKLEHYLESGGNNLTLDNLKLIRKYYLGEIDERANGGKQEFENYNKFVRQAIAQGYDSKKAARISMLLNDYLTDQHYRLLLMDPKDRNNPNINGKYSKFMGKISPRLSVSKDLKDFDYSRREEKEVTFYDFERAVFAPKNRKSSGERFNHALSQIAFMDEKRMTKYKVHTMEMAMNYAESSRPDLEKKDTLLKKIQDSIKLRDSITKARSKNFRGPENYSKMELFKIRMVRKFSEYLSLVN